MVGDPIEIRTEHLLNTNEERHRYANPFGTVVLRKSEVEADPALNKAAHREYV
jgi:hypothetical protein